MDDLRALIAGDQPATPATPSVSATSQSSQKDYSNLITDNILNGLKKTESGGDPYAVNKETKALGAYQFLPDTVAMMHKQGIKFNPFDEAQSRDAAKQYLTSLVNKNGGDVSKAVAQYGGFVTKDPSKYVASVLGGSASQATPQSTPEASGDPLRDLIAGSVAPTPNLSYPGAITPEDHLTPQQIEAKVNTTPFLGRMKPTGPNPAIPSIVQGAKNLGAGTASLLDTTVGGFLPLAGQAVQAIARPFTTPEKAAEMGQAVTSAVDKPFGKALGVTDNPAYQNEASRRIMDAIGQYGNQGASFIADKTGLPVQDVQNMIGSAMLRLPGAAGKVAKTVIAEAKMVGGSLADQMNATFAAKKASATPVQEGLGSAGAAATADQSAINELLTRASPELQNVVKTMQSNGQPISPALLENRVKAEQFGIKLTEGEASQHPGLLSEEYNSKKTNPAMAEHLTDRNPKLAQGFQDIRAQIAPDVYEPDPVKAANIALEDLVQKDANSKSTISANYKAAADANGGELPLSGKDFVSQAELQLKNAGPNLYRYVPPKIQGILDELKITGNMSLNDFEFYKTLFDNEKRLAERQGDKTTALAISKVLQGLESTPMSEASAPVKALYDVARQSAKQRFNLIDQNPAYKAAISDTRTADEIAQGVLHPAANKFVDNFYGPKTPQVNINRLVNLLGQNSEAHQGLNAAVIDKIAQASGVKGGANDVVSQAALNKQIRSIYQTNLPSMFPSEGLKKLQDLADVAALTEHVKPGTYSNVSNTAIAQTPSPIQSVGNLALKSVGTLAEGAANLKGGPVGGFIYRAGKEALSSRAAQKQAAIEAASQAEKNAAPFREGAGIGYTPLNKIGKP